MVQCKRGFRDGPINTDESIYDIVHTGGIPLPTFLGAKIYENLKQKVSEPETGKYLLFVTHLLTL